MVTAVIIMAICLFLTSHICLAGDMKFYKKRYNMIKNEIPVKLESGHLIWNESKVLYGKGNFMFLVAQDEKPGSLLSWVPTYCHPYSLYWLLKFKKLLKQQAKVKIEFFTSTAEILITEIPGDGFKNDFNGFMDDED